MPTGCERWAPPRCACVGRPSSAPDGSRHEMTDLLLEARIQALDDNLRRLEMSVEMFKNLYANSWRRTDLWVRLGDAVEQGVKDCDAKLEAARAMLAPPDDAPPGEDVPSPSEAWSFYTEAQA